ncbi:MAG: hypothetical protein Q9162_004448 [Coniocarpon cinnabarinum]
MAKEEDDEGLNVGRPEEPVEKNEETGEVLKQRLGRHITAIELAFKVFESDTVFESSPTFEFHNTCKIFIILFSMLSKTLL